MCIRDRDRVVSDINGNLLTLDAPLTVALDAKYGVSTIMTYQWNGRIDNCGVETVSYTHLFLLFGDRDMTGHPITTGEVAV